MQVAVSGGMNWNWFLVYSVNEDGTITRHAEDRFHQFDFEQGAAMDTLLTKAATGVYHVDEPHVSEVPFGAPRIATGITIDGTSYPFAEPEPSFVYHPFNWGDFAKTLA